MKAAIETKTIKKGYTQAEWNELSPQKRGIELLGILTEVTRALRNKGVLPAAIRKAMLPTAERIGHVVVMQEVNAILKEVGG